MPTLPISCVYLMALVSRLSRICAQLGGVGLQRRQVGGEEGRDLDLLVARPGLDDGETEMRTERSSTGSRLSSSLPASILVRSRMSLMRFSRVSPLFRILRKKPLLLLGHLAGHTREQHVAVADHGGERACAVRGSWWRGSRSSTGRGAAAPRWPPSSSLVKSTFLMAMASWVVRLPNGMRSAFLNERAAGRKGTGCRGTRRRRAAVRPRNRRSRPSAELCAASGAAVLVLLA